MKTKLFISSLFSLFIWSLQAQVGAPDPTFLVQDNLSLGSGAGFNDKVNSISIQVDGKILVGGEFTEYNGSTVFKIVRINADGSLDLSFQSLEGFEGDVHKVKVLEDGSILACGTIFSQGDWSHRGLVKLSANGEIVENFNPGVFESIYDFQVLENGQIIAISSSKVFRLDPDGNFDTSFSSEYYNNGQYLSAAIQSNGRIWVAGSFSSLNFTSRERIAKFSNTGVLLSSLNFSDAFNATATVIVEDGNGKFLVGGGFTEYLQNPTNRLTRLNSNESLDENFNIGLGFDDYVFSILPLENGKIFIGGAFQEYNGVNANRLVKLNSDGSIDDSFQVGEGFNLNVHTLAVQSDGKILVGGHFTSFGEFYAGRILRLNADGTFDETFNKGQGFNGTVLTTQIQVDNKVLVGGEYRTSNGESMNRLARLNSNGTNDPSFDIGTGFNDRVRAVDVQQDGKILVVGDFTMYNNSSANRIVRLNNDGSRDEDFSTGLGFNSDVLDVEVLEDGSILAVGYFTEYNGSNETYVVKLNPDGSFNADFSATVNSNSWITSIAIQSDHKILLGGYFSSFNSSTVNRIVRLNSDGTLDSFFDTGTGFNDVVRTIHVDHENRILVGGAFTMFNGVSSSRLVRLNTDGSLDESFDLGEGFNSEVLSIASNPDNLTIVGGAFTEFNGMNANRIIRLQETGEVDAIFNAGEGFNNVVHSISVQEDEKIIVGGNFTLANLQFENRLVRLLNCAPSLPTIDEQIGCGDFVWLDGINYTSSNNTATYNLYNSLGCDSLIFLNLESLNSFGIDTQTACGSFTWIDGNTYYNSTDSIRYTLENYLGCDSIVTLNLSIETIPSDSVFMQQNSLYSWQENSTYQWLDCNDNFSPIEGEMNASFTPSENGSYAVLVTTGNCSTTSDCILITTIGIDESDSHNFRIFPNPVINFLNIVLEDPGKSYRIFNTCGVIVKEGIINNSNTQIDVTSFASGIYAIQIESTTYKFVKLL